MSESRPAVDLLADIDPAQWWDDSDYALRTYVSPAPADELVMLVEEELGYRLPASYVAMMRRHNGGIPRLTCSPAPSPTSWASDHVELSGIFGIGRSLRYSLCGAIGGRFMVEEWGYPELGIYVANCPSAGHDMIAMDYRDVGAAGEPRIVHVDQERDYAVTELAPTFAQFVRGLRDARDFPDS
ncbi:SMI1/KNR4 family protein [Pseudonocardia sp. GCM10023141]|uniref:SMI1/KNR4 family protein n=1 Tax=Pseudonocardia sp. GCM10023141 TaxID=3252653 RepID=UPI00362107F3